MIFVPRPKLARPLVKELARLADQLDAQYRKRGAQTRLSFTSVPAGVKEALQSFFYGKCAYCESPGGSDAGMERFRPKQNALGDDNRSDPDHYFWLAYRWDNLLFACDDCNVAKRSQFPILARKRASPGATGKALAEERPLLVDPCGDRYPERHLTFDEKGFAEPLSPRGAATIAVLNLNRRPLVARRAEAIASAREVNDSHHVERLADLTAPWAAYSAAVNACLTRWTRKVQLQRKDIAAAYEQRTTPGTLRKIHIRNFRTIRRLTLAIPQHKDGTTPWLMLLGENGAGKSSLLQAVALALVGKEGIAAIGRETLDDAITNGESTARIVLTFEDPPSLVDLRLRRGKDPRFVKGGDGYPAAVVAYGASRLTKRDAQHPVLPGTHAARRIQNLFDPWVGLADPDLWLTKLEKHEFDYAARTLKDLLHLSQVRGDIFHVRKDRVVVDVNSDTVTIGQLSSGYRSIVALGTDLMSALPRGILDKQAAQGIVLIDEIDAHLHPRWKREVVNVLRSSFPHMQFLASTHEPLCLVGVKEKETVLMRRNEEDGGIEADADLPSPEGLRVDQLLTSRHFGLHTTIDPKLDAEFREYYRLLAIPDRERTEKQKKALAGLQKKLGNVGVLGYTRRDQLVYELIDRFIAEESRLSVRERKPLAKKLRGEVLDLWRHVRAVEEKK